MCGIVAYAGGKPAVPILLEGLRRLEYRGYDSAGVAVLSEGTIGVSRSLGKLANLDAALRLQPLAGSVGLGHTRWATHGSPSRENAHPHTDCAGQLAVIHNGIIENYAPLKAALASHGHVFRSATDTEVVAHLIEEELQRAAAASPLAPGGSLALVQAMRAALKHVRGAYALAVVWSQAPGAVAAAKSDSPLVVGLGDDETFMASDVPAFLRHTRKVVYLEDGELAVTENGRCTFYDVEGRELLKTPTNVDWDSAAAEKTGYPHFMLKEIYEQPRAIQATVRRLSPLDGSTLQRATGLTEKDLQAVSQVHVIACGTSWHAGTIGKYLLERYAGIQTLVETASEFRYRKPVLAPNTLMIAISQSGETADTLAAVRLARQSGLKVLSIGNTVGAAIPRQADFNLQTCCGPECGVASTKAFTGQLAALTMLTLHAGLARGWMQAAEAAQKLADLQRLPELVESALRLDVRLRKLAEQFARTERFLYIGRGVNYPVALEGALKLKEISYIHAEGFPAGEMKHGPLALIEKGTPVLAIATESEVLEKTLSNIEEARARGGRLIVLGTEGEERLNGKADELLLLPPAPEFISPALNIVPLQLLAYHVADLRGCDVDQPRNLAKSVTVE